MKTIRLFTCGISGALFSLILVATAGEPGVPDAEIKLRQSVISMNILCDGYPLGRMLQFLTTKANCGLSFQAENRGSYEAFNLPAGKVQDLDIILHQTSNNIFIIRMAVTNVTEFELINALIIKAGLKWRLNEKGVVIMLPGSSKYSMIEADGDSQMPKKITDWAVKIKLITNGMTRAEVEEIFPNAGGVVSIARCQNEYRITYNVDDMTAVSLGYDYTGIGSQATNKAFHEFSSPKNSASRLRSIYDLLRQEKSKEDAQFEWFE